MNLSAQLSYNWEYTYTNNYHDRDRRGQCRKGGGGWGASIGTAPAYDDSLLIFPKMDLSEAVESIWKTSSSLWEECKVGFFEKVRFRASVSCARYLNCHAGTPEGLEYKNWCHKIILKLHWSLSIISINNIEIRTIEHLNLNA